MKRATCGMIPWAALAMLCCGGAIRSQPASAQESRTVLIRAQHVHLGDGKVLSPGSVLVSDGKIVKKCQPIFSIEPDECHDTFDAGVEARRCALSFKLAGL